MCYLDNAQHRGQGSVAKERWRRSKTPVQVSGVEPLSFFSSAPDAYCITVLHAYVIYRNPIERYCFSGVQNPTLKRRNSQGDVR